MQPSFHWCIAGLDTAGARNLRLGLKQRAHLITERAELVFESLQFRELVWLEHIPYLDHGSEPLLGHLPSQVARLLGERLQPRVIQCHRTRPQEQVDELLTIRLQLAPKASQRLAVARENILQLELLVLRQVSFVEQPQQHATSSCIASVLSPHRVYKASGGPETRDNYPKKYTLPHLHTMSFLPNDLSHG